MIRDKVRKYVETTGIALGLVIIVAVIIAMAQGPEIANGRPVVYHRDARTGLCFAMRDFRSLTNVPCTDQVIELITDWP